MKKVKKTISLLLSAIIVALGFGGCKTPKSVINGEQELESKRVELNAVNKEIADGYGYIQQLRDEIKELIKRQNVQKVVYGPPPVEPSSKVHDNQ
mgnify:CR=1 FL=1